MPAAKDITGYRYGRLTVLEPVPTTRKNRHWLCRCECGTECVISLPNLKRQVSCGCWKSERLRTHGDWGDPLYWTWHNMNQRCHRPKHPSWPRYGGRGIVVCEEWRYPHGYAAFREHVGERPPGLTLDRIDNADGYKPGNVRWATRAEQQKNRG